MWREVRTLEDAFELIDIAELGDPDSYPVSRIKGKKEKEANNIIEWIKTDGHLALIYEDGHRHAGLRVVKNDFKDPSIGRVVNYVSFGFDPDLVRNWELAFPILFSKCREVFDSWGVKSFYGVIPRTRNGELVAYFADLYCWEKQSLDIEGYSNLKLSFNRDETKAPANEHLFEKVREASFIPDAISANLES